LDLTIDFAGVNLELHPLVEDQVSKSSEFVDGVFKIPPYTWGVFVQRR
jgi:hypothetical protein